MTNAPSVVTLGIGCKHRRSANLVKPASSYNQLVTTPVGFGRSIPIDIWDAYETIHVLMPDGSMKLGGEAVAETLRNLPNTKWFAWTFATTMFGFRPFQVVLNVAYAILSDVRPLFGCESCGKPKVLRPIEWVTKWAKTLFGESPHPSPTPHFSSFSTVRRRPVAVSGGPLPQERHF
jgi:hypothetical protein